MTKPRDARRSAPPPVWDDAISEVPADGRGRHRGRPGLSRDQIVRACIGIADTAGLEALSMRTAARRLGAGTMSIYWHVKTKDDLIDLMVDEVVGEAAAALGPSPDWPSALSGVAWAVRALVGRHPWVGQLLGGRPMVGPNALRLFEASLEALDGLDLDDDSRMQVFAALMSFVVGFAVTEVREREALLRAGMSDKDLADVLGPYLERALATGAYPRVARIVRRQGGAAPRPDPDAQFQFGLDCLLCGLAQRLGHPHP